jgi:hypothetical protein
MRFARSSWVVVFGSLLGCSSSDSSPGAAADTAVAGDTATASDTASGVDTATTDSATSTDTATKTDSVSSDTPTDVPVGTCAFVGEWTLEKFECGTTDITSSWKAIIPETTYVFSAGPLGCHVAVVNKSPACTEGQGFDWTVTTDGNVTAATSEGITSCDPASCKFNGSDAPCVVGDRASTGAATGESASIVKSGTKLLITVKKPGDICSGMDQHQTLAPK